MSEKIAQKSEQQILRDLQDKMVYEAEQLVRGLGLSGRQAVSAGRTQASKAIEVAQTAGSLLVFVNWLRYQAARESSSEFWARNTGGRGSLAKGLVTALGDLKGSIVKDMADKDERAQNRVTMQATTRFLGYLRRALIGADFLSEIDLPQPKEKQEG